MSAVELDLPQATREWLDAQPGGCREALRRILEEKARESGRELLGAVSLAVEEPWRDRWRPGPEGPVVAVCVMKAHLRELIDALAARLGWDEAAALAAERCRHIPEHPELACWKQIILTVHGLLSETPPPEPPRR
jgi:hypothetical protein